VRLWDLATRKQRATLKGHQYAVQSLAFSPDGKVLASGDHDGAIKLWEALRGTELKTIPHDPISQISGLAFLANGQTLASSDGDGRVIIWDVKTGRARRTMKEDWSVTSLAVSPDGQILAAAPMRLRSLSFWDTSTWQVLARPAIKAHSITFSPDGKTMATGGIEGTVRLWEVASLVGDGK
jgi:WD40 repeat protein